MPTSVTEGYLSHNDPMWGWKMKRAQRGRHGGAAKRLAENKGGFTGKWFRDGLVWGKE